MVAEIRIWEQSVAAGVFPTRWERGGGGAKPNNGRENPKSLRLAARLLAGARGAACRRSRVYVAGAGGE